MDYLILIFAFFIVISLLFFLIGLFQWQSFPENIVCFFISFMFCLPTVAMFFTTDIVTTGTSGYGLVGGLGWIFFTLLNFSFVVISAFQAYNQNPSVERQRNRRYQPE